MRVPFAEAIAEPRLLKPWFDDMSLPQQVALKVLYACPLSDKVKDERGWSELDYWAASQGHADFDELGFITRVYQIPYHPSDYSEAWGIWGIRGGKTDRFAATVVAYEAILGGHEDDTSEGRPLYCFQIAQDTRMAKYSLHSIHRVLKSMKFLNVGGKGDWITNITADRIELKNNVHVVVTPPTVKSIRGYDSPVAVLDEVGVWYQDADSANPDFEIYDQVNSRQAQFRNPKIIGISSPWNRGGMLFSRFEAGTNGRHVLCDSCKRIAKRDRAPWCDGCDKARMPHAGRLIMHSTTATQNPIIKRTWLQASLNKDPRAFERECLARFQDSISGFLPSALIEKARARGVVSRPADRRNFYVAAMDPAFRRDAFGFTIVHVEPDKGVIQDVVERWFDPTGSPQNPAEIFAEIAKRLREYGIRSVHTDQYSLETLQFLAQQFGFSLEEVTFSSESKAEIYGNLQALLRQGRLSILDDEETIKELKSLEKKNTQAGKVQIGAPEGMHDDMATVIAIAANEAVWMLPKKDPDEPAKKSIIERHIEHTVKSRARRVRESIGGDLDW